LNGNCVDQCPDDYYDITIDHSEFKGEIDYELRCLRRPEIVKNFTDLVLNT